jgi:hypothetical protein
VEVITPTTAGSRGGRSGDPDPLVRRAAAAALVEPGRMRAVLADSRDPGVRQLLAERHRRPVGAAPPGALRGLAGLPGSRALRQVTDRAVLEAIARDDPDPRARARSPFVGFARWRPEGAPRLEVVMRALFLLVLLTGSAGSVGAAVVTSTAQDRTAVSVTVYNDGRGLVREERALQLPAAADEIRFVDVAAKVEPPTVRVAVLDGSPLPILEQNYEYDLLSPQTLMEKFVGKTVTLVRPKRDGTDLEETPARLLSTNQGVVWEVDGRIVVDNAYTRVAFPSVPDNLVARPTLVWRVKSPAAGRRRVEAAYLTGGMKWQADYVLALEPDEKAGRLQGWVTVDNRSGAGYENARLQLVAGDVHRARPEADLATPTRYGGMTEQMKVTQMQREALFEYHLYTVPQPTTINEKQTKQVLMLDSSRIVLDKEYVLRGAESLYRQAWQVGARPRPKVRVYVTGRNSADVGLGMPLPKGVVRVYKRDSMGGAQFVGEDRIDHTARDEEWRVEMGNTFDVAAERIQADFKRPEGTVIETAYELRLRNRKDDPITVRVIEPIGGDWTMLQNSHPYKKTAAFEAEFQLPVRAGEEVVLTYRVRIR